MPANRADSRISSTQVMYRARAMKLLRRPLLLTRAGMLAERVTRAFWPLWSWGFVVWTALSFGLFNRFSVEVAYFSLLGAVALMLLFLADGVRRFRWPAREEALDRLDRSLKGRPLTALWDTQALGGSDRGSTALWRAHVTRMAEQAAGAGPVEPDLKISDRDPYALRYVAATAFVIALLFGVTSPGSGLNQALSPDGSTATPTGPAFEGWIEPPRYTGLPSIYLNEVKGDAPIPVPQGSKITLRLYGPEGALSVTQNVAPPADPLIPVSDEADLTQPKLAAQDFFVSQSGEIVISDSTGTQARWRLEMTPDLTPTINLAAPLERSPAGEMRLSFEAGDDYGVVAGSVTINLDMAAVDRRYGLAAEPLARDPITLDLPLPFNGDLTGFTETLVEDLAQHPWAGLPVRLTLQASDALDQVGISTSETMTLPGRRFFDPLAAAIVEQRRDLLWSGANATRVAQVLRAVSYLPEDLFDNEKAYLLLRSAIRRLEARDGPDVSHELRDEVAEMLWKSALMIEDGDLSDAEKRLRRAEERLSEALRNGATQEEIAELTEELRRAMQDYMERLAQEAERNPEQQSQQQGERREITSDQLQDMLDRIEELSRQGRNEEAQALLEQLRQMMQNMQTVRRQPGEGPGQQAMRDMQDTLRQQQQLADDAFRRLQEEFNGQRQPGQAPNGGRPGMGQRDGRPGQPGVPSQQELAQRQEALRQLLESQRGNLPGADSEEGRAAREALRRAEREMGEARDSLNQGDLPQALNDQADALEALREGLENMGRELARNQNNNTGRQGDQAGSPDPGSQRDPLGREVGTVGRFDSGENLLDGQDRFMRSRELQEEIRRRSGDKSRPKIELDYLERLLDRF